MSKVKWDYRYLTKPKNNLFKNILHLVFPNQNMSFSPSSSTVRHTVDLTYAVKKKSISIKWSIVNGILLSIFFYDTWCACPGYKSALYYVELCLVFILAFNFLHHLWRLATPLPPPLPNKTPQKPTVLDSSFRSKDSFCMDTSDVLSTSLSPERSWRTSSTKEAVPSPQPVSPLPRTTPPDHFIADHNSLTQYLKKYEEQSKNESFEEMPTGAVWSTPVSYYYQLASIDRDGSLPEDGSTTDANGTVVGDVWRKLNIDPRHLTHANLNLRLWLHVTILERLVRAMDSVDESLDKHGIASSPPELSALMPFLSPFPDRQYVVRRIRELAAGGCLCKYRWDGGGTSWDESQPADAELLLHLFATYLDGQVAGGEFSARHLSSAPGPPPRTIGIHRVSRRPPHYCAVLDGEVVEVGKGRNNLLHAMLALVAAAARLDPPMLCRTHLGPAGLNLLWIFSR